jgi:ribosomal protein L37AE/L43A
MVDEWQDEKRMHNRRYICCECGADRDQAYRLSDGIWEIKEPLATAPNPLKWLLGANQSNTEE